MKSVIQQLASFDAAPRTLALGAFALIALSGFSGLSPALAADTRASTKPAAPVAGPQPGSSEDIGGGAAERVNVENIKEKYWARGDESELGVVQNRQYTKARKFDLGVFTGIVATDPFLSVKSLGGTLGFHFNEYFGVSLFGYKAFVSPSSAYEYLQRDLSTGANTNEPRWFLGAEGNASLIYGKLSVLGKLIIHYDLHFLGGMGVTATESGNNFTPYVGIGQQFYLSRLISLQIDYRLMHYNEAILQKVGSPSSPNGTFLGNRSNWANSISLGITFLIDPFGKKQPDQTQ